MIFPEVSLAAILQPNKSRLFIGAYGFEERSLGWANYQLQQGIILNHACMFKYDRPKGKNRIRELKKILKKLGIEKPKDIHYDAQYPFNIEEVVDTEFSNLLSDFEEIIVDITSMTKLLILVCLCKLSMFSGTLRIVYSEAEDYAPTKKEYDEWKRECNRFC